MRRVQRVLLVLLAAVSGFELGASASSPAEPSSAPRLIVKLSAHKATFSSDELAALTEQPQSTVSRLIRPVPRPPVVASAIEIKGFDRWRVVTLRPGADPQQVASQLVERPEVESVEIDRRLEPALLPNDPHLFLDGSWGQEESDLWGLHLTEAPAAWDLTTGEGVVIAVIDSGADLGHEDLAANLWLNPGEIAGNGLDDDDNGFADDVHGWSYTNGGAEIVDTNGHGSHVAGIAAAVGNNGVGIAGMAWQSRVMVLQTSFVSQLAEAIIYAAANGARVINMSVGTTIFSPALDDALAIAHGVGVVGVAGAGNDANPVTSFHPASSRYAIAVGASDSEDERAGFSNFGNGLDMLAPGVRVLSLLSEQLIPTSGPFGIDPTGRIVGERYLWLSGTSMAAPHVAGLAALVVAQHPEATPEEVRQILRRSAVDLGRPGWDLESGWGRIDAGAAVSAEPIGSARMLTPRPTRYSGSELDIGGFADGGAYRIEIGSGEDPEHWTEVGSGPGAPDHRPLGSVDLGLLADGFHTLRLRVEAPGGTLEDRVGFELDRITIADELLPPAIRRGETLEIRGRIGDPTATSFFFEYFDPIANVWSTAGFDLEGDGGLPLAGGLDNETALATWNTDVVGGAEFYQVRLVVERGSLPPLEESFEMIVDPSLHPGWPRALTTSTLPRSPLIVADLDSDGVDELLTASVREVQVVGADGRSLPGWPRSTPRSATIGGGPAVGDLDGDGDLELVVGLLDDWVYAWHHDGSPVAGWPRGQGGARVAISDLDGAPGAEIVAVSSFASPGSIRSFTGSGVALGSASIAGAVADGVSMPAVGNVVGDDRPEIVVSALTTSDEVEVHVFRSDGSSVDGFPIEISVRDVPFPARSHPVLGDLDRDGVAEIVVADGGCAVHVLSGTGATREGWPQELMPEDAVCAAPSLGDLDGDGRPEVVLGGSERRTPRDRVVLAVWNAGGTLLPGWPVDLGPLGRGNATQGFSTAAVLDVDGDGRAEIVADRESGNQPPFAVEAFRQDGTRVPGFAKPVTGSGTRAGNGPATGDLDGDGYLELVWMNRSGEVYVWDLLSGAGASGVEWAMPRANAARSALYAPPSTSGGCDSTPTSLCLNGGRFVVTVDWVDFEGRSGVGKSVELTSDSGAFWFFSPANVELMVKVLDGRQINGFFWVFYGSLSDVRYTLTVTDTVTGRRKHYENPSGGFASRGDTSAFEASQ